MIKQIVFEDEITLWWEKNEIAKNAIIKALTV